MVVVEAETVEAETVEVEGGNGGGGGGAGAGGGGRGGGGGDGWDGLGWVGMGWDGLDGLTRMHDSDDSPISQSEVLEESVASAAAGRNRAPEFIRLPNSKRRKPSSLTDTDRGEENSPREGESNSFT